MIKRIHLDYPFDLKLKLLFRISGERPFPSSISNDRYIRAIRIGDNLYPIIVSQEGDEIIIEGKMVDDEIVDKVCLLLGIGDCRKLYSFMRKDKVLKKVLNKLYGFGIAPRMALSVFEGLVKIIIQQQISIYVAGNITSNLIEKYGDFSVYKDLKFYDFPTPEKIIDAGVEGLKRCGLSTKKSEYIINVAESVMNGYIDENMKNLEDEDIIKKITGIKGLGRWSAELFMLACLGRNVVPADDLGVRRVISNLYFDGEMQNANVIRKFVEKKFKDYLRDVIVYLIAWERI